jgi:hypothetical protein
VNANRQSREQIIAALRDKISAILSIPASSVENSKHIWKLFPPNSGRVESKELTEFGLYVANEFKVYLTEREWDAPTLAKLADHIVEKQANPEHMLAQIKKDWADQRMGLKVALICWPIIFGLCGIFSVTEAPPEKRLYAAIFMAGLICFMELITLAGWVGNGRKFKRQTEPVLQFYNFQPEVNRQA